jgi:hypothetical protein
MLWGEYNYDEDIAVQRQEAFDEGIHKKAIESAKIMLKDNIPKNAIIKYTGLPTETIEQLAKESTLTLI